MKWKLKILSPVAGVFTRSLHPAVSRSIHWYIPTDSYKREKMININIFLNTDAPISASMIYHRQVPSTAVDVKYRFQSKGLKEHLFRDTTLAIFGSPKYNQIWFLTLVFERTKYGQVHWNSLVDMFDMSNRQYAWKAKVKDEFFCW